jgi:UDPglucose 6-dehydrogenase
MDERISVIGLGKLGLPLAACFAQSGIETIGVDLEESVVTAINQGVAPIIEHQLPEMISRLGGKSLIATLDHRRAIDETDITVILVATPSNPDGSFSNRYVEMALQSLAETYRESQKDYHLFVISSTVMPGSIEGSLIPLIERVSGRELGQGFDVCYIPDFVALGQVVHDFLHPDLVVLGETSPVAGDRMEAIYRKIWTNNPYVGRMSIISSEIAKVSLNAYITTKISFANMLANLCERIPGADVDDITQTIGHDKRISPHYFRGGLGYGGTCFPRDTWAFIKLSNTYGFNADLIQAVEKINTYQNKHLLPLILNEISQWDNPVVGIVGLAFKPGTPVITASPSICLINKLLEHGISIIVYDPLATEETRKVFGSRINYSDTIDQCLDQCSICVLMHSSLDLKRAIENYLPNWSFTIVDGWRLLNPLNLDPGINYIPLGRFKEQLEIGKNDSLSRESSI